MLLLILLIALIENNEKKLKPLNFYGVFIIISLIMERNIIEKNFKNQSCFKIIYLSIRILNIISN